MLRLFVAAATVAAVAGLGAEPADTAAAGGRLKIGLVMAAGNDPWQRAAVAGLKRAARKLAVTGTVRTTTPREGFVAPLTEFASAGYDLVVGLGSAPDALEQVASAFPAVRFAALDTRRAWLTKQPPPRNLTGIAFRAQEAGYLAGYLAGLVEKRRPGRDMVSAVGSYSFPGVDRWIAGFRAGARRADPRIKQVLIGYAKSFTAPQLCAAVAASQIAAGSGVVLSAAGRCGLGALREARKAGIWGVGVDTDQSSLGRYILTSAVTRPDVALFQTIRALRRHRYRSGADMSFGLREDGVGLAGTSPRVQHSFKTRVNRIERKIASGKIVVPATLG